MIGPPALKFRMKKFELFAGSDGAGAGLASAATVAVTAGELPAAGLTDASVAGEVGRGGAGPRAAAVPPGAAAGGGAGDMVAPAAGETAGDAARPVGDDATPAGDVAGLVAGGADGTWAKTATAMVTELRLTNS